MQRKLSNLLPNYFSKFECSTVQLYSKWVLKIHWTPWQCCWMLDIHARHFQIFCKVVQHQIWVEVVGLIPDFSVRSFLNASMNESTAVILKTKVTLFVSNLLHGIIKLQNMNILQTLSFCEVIQIRGIKKPRKQTRVFQCYWICKFHRVCYSVVNSACHLKMRGDRKIVRLTQGRRSMMICLLYTSDAADDYSV